MKIQNKSLPNTDLTLRYARDEDGNQLVVRSDARGVFEVAEKDALFLLKTKGWAKPASAVPEAPTEETPKKVRDTALRPPSLKPKGDAPSLPLAPEETAAEASDEVEDEATTTDVEGPDVSVLRTKAAALALGAMWEERGYIVKLDKEMTLAEMKDAIEIGVYGKKQS